MENYFDANIYVVKGGKKHCFFLQFRNRLMVGDVLTVREMLDGVRDFYMKRDATDADIQDVIDYEIDELKKIGVDINDVTIVTSVHIHPIVFYSSVDFSADVSIVLNNKKQKQKK
jgi:hypothetical protein